MRDWTQELQELKARFDEQSVELGRVAEALQALPSDTVLAVAPQLMEQLDELAENACRPRGVALALGTRA